MSSSPVPLKTRHVEEQCTLNLSRAKTSSRWCGVVVRRNRGRLSDEEDTWAVTPFSELPLDTMGGLRASTDLTCISSSTLVPQWY
ncbi:hypothetical protein TNCV_3568191 [Trichonephila clavipes]|nr:hypothetical protein TNCV_3568191 [Trichonephila clavipes]